MSLIFERQKYDISSIGDGINNVYIMEAANLIDSHMAQFTIYDRWGNHVIELNKEEVIMWNGNQNGCPLNSVVYTYS